MKRNLLYLAGFLLAAATVFSGCNDDDPSYHDLVPNTQELIINLDETPEGIIQIVQGNGNYKITSSNEDVATAIAEGNKIKVTATPITTSFSTFFSTLNATSFKANSRNCRIFSVRKKLSNAV